MRRGGSVYVSTSGSILISVEVVVLVLSEMFERTDVDLDFQEVLNGIIRTS